MNGFKRKSCTKAFALESFTDSGPNRVGRISFFASFKLT